MNPQLIKQAKEYASQIAENSLGLVEIIFLDQWRCNFDEEKSEWRFVDDGKWRLTYLGREIGMCSNDCQNCPVYIHSDGEDNPNADVDLITTLVKAEEKDKKNYDGNQDYLNCKSLDQYITSFVRCFQGECHTREEISDELDYVAGFKVVYSSGQESLETMEEKIKQRIVKEVLDVLDERRKKLFLEITKARGLTK